MGEVVPFERVAEYEPALPRKLLNAREVAAILGVSETMAYHLLATEIPAVRMGKSVRVRPETLQVWIEGRESPPTGY